MSSILICSDPPFSTLAIAAINLTQSNAGLMLPGEQRGKSMSNPVSRQTRLIYDAVLLPSPCGAHRLMICAGVKILACRYRLVSKCQAALYPYSIESNCTNAESDCFALFPTHSAPVRRMFSGLLFLIPRGNFLLLMLNFCGKGKKFFGTDKNFRHFFSPAITFFHTRGIPRYALSGRQEAGENWCGWVCGRRSLPHRCRLAAANLPPAHARACIYVRASWAPQACAQA